MEKRLYTARVFVISLDTCIDIELADDLPISKVYDVVRKKLGEKQLPKSSISNNLSITLREHIPKTPNVNLIGEFMFETDFKSDERAKLKTERIYQEKLYETYETDKHNYKKYIEEKFNMTNKNDKPFNVFLEEKKDLIRLGFDRYMTDYLMNEAKRTCRDISYLLDLYKIWRSKDSFFFGEYKNNELYKDTLVIFNITVGSNFDEPIKKQITSPATRRSSRVRGNNENRTSQIMSTLANHAAEAARVRQSRLLQESSKIQNANKTSSTDCSETEVNGTAEIGIQPQIDHNKKSLATC